MSLFLLGKTKRDERTQLRERVQLLQEEQGAVLAEAQELRELVRHLDDDHRILLEALGGLRPTGDLREVSEGMLGLVFKPFNLASFFVAAMDWEEDLLAFPFYWEGGRSRNHPARRLSPAPGLTGRALLAGRPLYTRTLDEAQELGAIFTEAEKGSGIIPASWYGVPFGFGERPAGLVSFQSFEPDAFPEPRRATMDALVALVGLATRP
jgi:hypothetical protein